MCIRDRVGNLQYHTVYCLYESHIIFSILHNICSFLAAHLQLSDSSSEEREWACRSLSHLIQEEGTLKQLMRARLVRKTTPLLLDQVLTVRESAAGLLRLSPQSVKFVLFCHLT